MKHSQIVTYAKNYAEKFVRKEVPLKNEDCWYCWMRIEQKQPFKSIQHLKKHIENEEYVPSLLDNAIRLLDPPKPLQNYVKYTWYHPEVRDESVTDSAQWEIALLLTAYLTKYLK